MATINYTTEVNLESGYVKVDWAGIGVGDVALPFECSGLRLGSIQYSGDFGSTPGSPGTVRMCGSNELSPTNFGEFAFSMAPRLQAPPDGLLFMGTVRPVVDANIVSVNVALIFVPRD
jgi:hypothetical protein